MDQEQTHCTQTISNQDVNKLNNKEGHTLSNPHCLQ